MQNYITFLFCFVLISCNAQTQDDIINEIIDIPTPNGYERVNSEINSFAYFLQHQKINNSRNKILLYNKQLKSNQNVHYAILDIDIGEKDLQQCADAIIRLRAEYLWQTNKKDEIHFNFTSGDTAFYSKFKNGYRANISGNNVVWQLKTEPDTSYKNFKKYLENVFTYAGTYSMNKELFKVKNPEQMKIGDVFIQPGNPFGHAIIVVDLAINEISGDKVFVLAQSYMPAQDIHILKNPSSISISPWYKLNSQNELITPEWTFTYNHLKRFKN